MTDKELKKLDKSELLQLLIELSGENDELRARNAELEAQSEELSQKLSARSAVLREPGSIAEEALRLSGIFEAAQAAADDYLATVRGMNEKQDGDYRRIIEEAMAQADAILCEAEEAKAKKIAEADTYWNEMQERMDRFMKDHEWFSRLMKEKSSE